MHVSVTVTVLHPTNMSKTVLDRVQVDQGLTLLE